jgi:hypothetical protein
MPLSWGMYVVFSHLHGIGRVLNEIHDATTAIKYCMISG